MIVAGVDVGSVGSKAVLFDGQIVSMAMTPTGWNPKMAGKQAVEDAACKAGIDFSEIKYILGTGYGRGSLEFINSKVTEITCHGTGARYLFPNTRTVIDIGGQDSKVIKLDENGQVADFIMNDKCAAGTGRFLQTLSQVLAIDVSELSSLAAGAVPLPINSMCTVFAESEVISLLAQGNAKERIAAGILQSIASRTAGMVNRIGIDGEVVFTGGAAKNNELVTKLAQALNTGLQVPEISEFAGALGAAVIAYNKLL